ncbi:Peptidoglycan binding domain protein [Myxococcus hansupus]|uniref:Peptidoglycan binding domain protein n=1 Tax=Pseudomyxococcus hansupus TaxID=1297742 RepID=A0A0H4WK63_9BACT|nr:peptidoglycan-binding protein [Myxococcus hansupus]AKQ63114.1 Peptidoglycan binding domain protein [Myxococcus hansupus]
MTGGFASDPAIQPCSRERSFIEVVVVGDDQAPLPDMVLELREPGSHRVVRARTDKHGRFRFRGLKPGAHDVRLPGVDPSLWRPLGWMALKPEGEAASEPPWAEPPPDEAITWTCRGHETLGIVAARLGLRPSRLVEQQQGAAPAQDVPLAQGAVLQAEPPPVRWESVATGRRQVLHRIGLPVSLVLRMRDDLHAPRGRRPYLLKISLETGAALPHRRGTTDEEGRVVELLPPSASSGELLLDLGSGAPVKMKLRFAALPIPAEDAGLQPRLENLGYPCGGERGAPGPHTRAALQWFQYASGLPVTGEADADTRLLLFALHQS